MASPGQADHRAEISLVPRALCGAALTLDTLLLTGLLHALGRASKREHINRVLADCGGNIYEAARVLGIHRRSLQQKLAKFPSPR